MFIDGLIIINIATQGKEAGALCQGLNVIPTQSSLSCQPQLIIGRSLFNPILEFSFDVHLR
jgi:hypothetical protein